MGFGKVHSVVNRIWHTSLMEVLVWPGPSWPIAPIVLMSREIPAVFAQHALVDSWPVFNIGTTTMSVPMHPRRSEVLKCIVHTICVLLVCHIETVSQTPALDRNFMVPPSWAMCMHLYLVICETRLWICRDIISKSCDSCNRRDGF
jgi:hypothetical protein